MNEKARQIQEAARAKQTSKVVRRKRSYRPLQYTVVVTSFAASLLGAVWLQSHNTYAASSASLPNSAVSQVAPAPVSQPSVQSSDDASTSAPDQSAPSVQESAPVQRFSFPRAAARSRSSR